MPNYGDVTYWNQRYKNSPGETFDWLEDYSTLKQYLSQYLEKETKILNLGCGNSLISEQLYDNGYQNIFNIDISPIVINQMQERNLNRTMQFQVMDALNLEFQDGTFDLVLDKSTLDAILCGSSSFTNTATMFKEVQRVLKSGGIYMIISYGEPQSRLVHLKRDFLDFKIDIVVIEREVKWMEEGEAKHQNLQHYIYICKKQNRMRNDQIFMKFQETLQQLRSEEEENVEEEYEQKQDELDELISQYSIDKTLPFNVLLEKLKSEPQYLPILQELGYI